MAQFLDGDLNALAARRDGTVGIAVVGDDEDEDFPPLPLGRAPAR